MPQKNRAAPSSRSNNAGGIPKIYSKVDYLYSRPAGEKSALDIRRQSFGQRNQYSRNHRTCSRLRVEAAGRSPERRYGGRQATELAEEVRSISTTHQERARQPREGPPNSNRM